jgi:hypothetical protein
MVMTLIKFLRASSRRRLALALDTVANRVASTCSLIYHIANIYQTRSATGSSKPRVFEAVPELPAAPTKKKVVPKKAPTEKKPVEKKAAKPKKAVAEKKEKIKKTVAGKVTKAKKVAKVSTSPPLT